MRGIVARFLEVTAQTAPVAAPAAPAPTPVSPMLDAAAVTQALLALIADRTGYPVAMLEPDLNLEADLGIDSIKRVEILGALRADLLPDAGDALRSAMGPVSREKTVRGIVARFLEVTAAAASAPAPQAITPTAAQPAVDPMPDLAAWPARFVMAPHPIDAPAPVEWVVRGGVYVLTDDGAGVAQGLAARITARGGVARLLDAALDLADDRGLRAAVADIGSAAAGLIHCAPLRAGPDFEAMTLADWTAAVDGTTRAFYTLLSALGPVLAARSDAVVLCATAMGGGFGFDLSDLAQPAMGGAPGLLKTVAKEWHAVHCRAVDFATGSAPRERIAALDEEAGRKDGTVEVGQRGAERLGLFAEARPITPALDAPPVLDRDSVVLVTGGARGITARIALQLARSFHPRLVLLGSSPVPEAVEAPETAGLADPRALKEALIAAARRAGQPVAPAAIEATFRAVIKAREVRAALAAMTAAGARVEYLACDVRDSAAFRAAIADVRARHGRIDGVVHGAGVIEDKLILDKEVASFDNVVHLKTASAFTLAQALDPATVKFLVFFTSVAGRFGNRGQGDYGAANEIVSKLARRLDARWPGRVKAISWGPWDSGGMVSPEIRAQFAAMRIEPIPPALGVQALEIEATQGPRDEPEVVWGRGPWQDDDPGQARLPATGARYEAAE